MTLRSTSDLENRKRRALWHCRRGTKELDVILATFIENEFEKLTEQEIVLFETLLETQDPLLNEWLYLGKEPEQKDMQTIVTRILSSHKPTPRS